jgi:uncharacterized protein YbbC (DUF1343 family)
MCTALRGPVLALIVFPVVATLALVGCSERSSTAPPRADTTDVRTGAEVLAAGGLSRLDGQRVGLIVNQTSRVDTSHLIDVVHRAPDVELKALFAPEHGLEGRADAGETIEGGRDPQTGVPIYSLYGASRQPPPEALDSLDVLVFDIQDIGARFYTYISTMGRAMQAAAQKDVPFLVLDRPNPLGGERVAGFVLEPEHPSFVGAYPIPIQHGLTVGELARMIQGEGWMDGLDDLDLSVVPVDGWTRGDQWPDVDRSWVAPSPNIPDFETALIYPGAVFFEATAASEGRGTPDPFLLVGAPWADAQALADTLNARDLPGVRFEPTTFTPTSRPGASSPKLEGESLSGVRHVVTDRTAYRSVATGVHVLHAFYHQAPSKSDFLSRPNWLVKLAGTTRLLDRLRAGRRPPAIIEAWQDEVAAFRERRAPYLLY